MKKLIKVINNVKGTSLVETMIAISIFAIVLTGVLNLSLGNMATGKRGRIYLFLL